MKNLLIVLSVSIMLFSCKKGNEPQPVQPTSTTQSNDSLIYGFHKYVIDFDNLAPEGTISSSLQNADYVMTGKMTNPGMGFYAIKIAYKNAGNARICYKVPDNVKEVLYQHNMTEKWIGIGYISMGPDTLLVTFRNTSHVFIDLPAGEFLVGVYK